jgi:uncharacterized protein with von Willebrand factor type A (vWA) domain
VTEPGLLERPVEWTARLAHALRQEGVPSTVLESLIACEALERLDAADGLDVYFGLKAAFTSSPDHQAAYERCFWAFWGGSRPGDLASAERESSEPGDRANVGSGAAGMIVLARPHRPRDAENGQAHESSAVTGVSYSPDERLSHRSFEQMDEGDFRRVDRVFDRILLRLATRKSRRYRPHRRRGRLDLRRSFRDAVAHDGELVRLARRRRRLERPRVVLLCDVSGSMERYSRFLIRFLLAAGRDRDVESFVFSTRLTRLTPWLTASNVDRALDSLSSRVHDWSGGTRIGACLDEFVRQHGRSLLGQRTVVVILSDGLDRGDVRLLERAMRAIHRRARKVIWLNPLLASPRYEPTARGMRAALPHIDTFARGHNLESLLELERHLSLA